MLALQNEVTRVVARAKPSVVAVTVSKPASAYDQNQEKASSASTATPSAPFSGVGTGWVFRSDGLILTNYHVVRDAISVHVTFNADTFSPGILLNTGVPARVVGYDADFDIAVLKINRANLPILELADSDAAQVGEWTIAIGASEFWGRSVTLGVLSGKDRLDLERLSASPAVGSLPAYLQTDAPLNQGNSGGPLLDLNGRVVGLNTKGIEGSGSVGFSLPSNTIRALLPQLLSGKRARHAMLGFTPNGLALAPEVAREFGLGGGVLVGSLAKKNGADSGPAKKAGVRKNDIIFGVEGKPVTTALQLKAFIGGRAPGETIRLSIARIDFAGTGNVQKLTAALVLGESTLMEGSAAPAASLAPDTPITGPGLSVVDASALDAVHKERYGIKGTESGAVVSGIVPLSRADEAGLFESLRIVRARLNGKWTDISSAASWKTFEASAAPDAHLLLEVRDLNDEDEFHVLISPAK